MSYPVTEVLAFDSHEELSSAAADIFQEIAPKKVALAGGSTPRRCYELLSSRPVDWSGVEVCLTDERMVAPTDDRSNWKMIDEVLLSQVGARGYPIDTSSPPSVASASYALLVERMVPFDLVLLGLGADGHTASLFPGDPELVSRDPLVRGITDSDPARVTLTFGALDSATLTVFLVSGEEKRQALGELLEGGDIPAAQLKPTGDVLVLADRDALGANQL